MGWIRALTLIALCMPLVANAHHSQAAFFSDRFAEFEGEVTEVFWRNPHVGFSIRRIDENGREEIWELESNSLNTLSRMGIRAPIVKEGDRVKVAGLLSRHGLTAMRVTNVLLPNGEEVVLMPNLVDGPRWAREARAGEAPQRGSDASAAHGLFRIWTSGIRPNTGSPAQDLPLTAAARRAREAWDPVTEDPALRCIAPGMPAMMSNPYPIQFVDEGDRIVLRLEEWDGVRTIHMNPDILGDLPPTPAGHSVGRWEGNTLVVTTTKVSWPYFDDFGTPQSSDVEIVERFTLSPDETRLDYRAVVTDPQTFASPVTIDSYWHWVPGEEIKPYQCALREPAE